MEVSSTRRGRSLLHPFRAPRSDPERLHAIVAAELAAAKEHDLEDLLSTALDHALAFTGLQAGAGFVLTSGGERVIVRVVAGSASAGGTEWLTPGTVLRGPLAALHQQALAARRPLQHPVPRVDQPAGSAAVPAVPAVPGVPGAYLALPLITGRQRALGTLFLSSAAYQQPLAPEDVEVLQAVAAQIAPAVENAQLHEQLERTLDELLTLYGAGQAISSSLELQEVLSGILEMSRRLARADCCLITGPDENGELVVFAERGMTAEWLAYRTTPSVRLTVNAVLRDGTLRPLGIPPVTGWCIGLKVRQQLIGALEVYSRGGPPRYDESHLLTGLATQAAIAIENAKLYQAVREKEAHLQDLVERMIQAQEEDRRRVAYDIHDGLAQLMVSAHQHLQTFGMLHSRQDSNADQSLAKGLFMLQKSIEEVRKVIAGLRPSELDDFGLVAAMRLYVQSLRDDFGWQVDLAEDVGPHRLPAPVEVTAYRIVQEALTNARRHGEAAQARVELIRRDGALFIEVRDWGRGFDVGAFENEPPGDSEVGRHVGLHGMRERAHLLGGTFDVHSTPGEGTTVRVRMPINEHVETPVRLGAMVPTLPPVGTVAAGGTAAAGGPAAATMGSPEAAALQPAQDGDGAGGAGGAMSNGGVVGGWPIAARVAQREPAD